MILCPHFMKKKTSSFYFLTRETFDLRFEQKKKQTNKKYEQKIEKKLYKTP